MPEIKTTHDKPGSALHRLFMGDASGGDPLSLEGALQQTLTLVLQMVPAAQASVYLRVEATGQFRCQARRDSGTETGCHASAVPLFLDGERQGFLLVRFAQPFTADALSQLAECVPAVTLAVENLRRRQQERREAERRALLDHLSGYLHQTLELDTLISRLFAEVNQAIHAEAQSIWLVEEDAGVIACRFATGPGAAQVTQVAVPLGEGIVGNTVASQKSLLVADAQQDSRHSRRAQNLTGMVTRSMMSVPLVHQGRALGAIQAINKHGVNGDGANEGAVFDKEDLDLFRDIADIAALCIENARLYADLQTSYDTTLEALVSALEARDHETEGHSRRVVEYTARLAREIGLNGDALHVARRGALIHDIGKIGVPDAILNKPGALSPQEQQVMARHPEAGFAMLRGIPHLQREILVVLAHHERWDGSGYPLGLKGGDIPLEARLFAVADTFDAITSDRPYRSARPYREAARIITHESGDQFDPAIVAAFLRVPEEEWSAIRESIVVKRAALPPQQLPGKPRSPKPPFPLIALV